ncbi:MAG: type II toxin-antitoxin system VapC family toxin [Casimicrobiaceae bacterium]
MILVETSVWVGHLRKTDERLVMALDTGQVLAHPFVIGELACGHLQRRAELLGLLAALPAAPVASQAEVLGYIERHALAGRGIGFVDVHLLAATSLASDATLWTRDKRLAATAESLGIA